MSCAEFISVWILIWHNPAWWALQIVVIYIVNPDPMFWKPYPRTQWLDNSSHFGFVAILGLFVCKEKYIGIHALSD